MQKFKILRYSTTAMGFALLLIALYARLYSVTESGIEGATYPFLFLVVPFVFLGICALAIGAVAFSVPSLEKRKKGKWKRSSLKKMKETKPLTQEVQNKTESEQPKPQTMPKADKTFSYMLFILGVFLISIGIFLSTYTTVAFVNTTFNYGYGSFTIPVATQIHPYLGIAIAVILSGVVFICISLYKIQKENKTQLETIPLPPPT